MYSFEISNFQRNTIIVGAYVILHTLTPLVVVAGWWWLVNLIAHRLYYIQITFTFLVRAHAHTRDLSQVSSSSSAPTAADIELNRTRVRALDRYRTQATG